ncbi:proteasome assembly chaperone 1 [Chrysoperla carnea]|uniref:proteasome assembly chaperone 1 n=1 Tax=Chrysoperla carnea TaxID=189513 RepID=UPI001D06AE79|nr:proteasome assembly chaperone 1 [Chrysoperla carnea]
MTLFGEIIEPSSRALCDFEEDLDVVPTIDLKWEGLNEPPNTISLLLCAEGKSSLDLFRKSVLNNARKVCTCQEIGVEIYQISLNNEQESLNKYVCLFGNSNRYNDAEVIESIRPWIENSKQVVCFLTQKMVEYLTRLSQEKPAILLRMLQVSNSNELMDKLPVPILEQPNIITGKLAAVISYRLHIDKPGTIFICYLDQIELDSTTAEPLLSLLNKLNIKTVPYTAGVPKNESNLYL